MMIRQPHFQSAQKRHAKHYLRQLTRLNDRYLEGGQSALHAIQQLREIIEQVNHARQWALDKPEVSLPELYAIRFLETGQNILGIFLNSRQMNEWVLTTHQQVYALADAYDRMVLDLMAAKSILRIELVDEALPYLESGLQLALELDEGEFIVEAYNSSGIVQIYIGNGSQAIYYFEKALEVAEKLDNELSYIKALGNLGVAYRRASRYTEAAECMEKTLALCVARDDLHGQSIDLTNLGELYLTIDEFAKARDYMEKSLDLNEQLGNARGINLCHLNLGLIYTRLEEYPVAFEHLDAARQYYRQNENWANLGSIYSILGEWSLKQNRLNEAEAQFEESLFLRQKVNQRVNEAVSWQYLGKTYHAMENYERALEYFQAAVEINQETNQQAGLAGVYWDIAKTREAQGNLAEAIANWRIALNIYTELGDDFDESRERAEQELARLQNLR